MDKSPPDIQRKLFIHYGKPAKGGVPGPPTDKSNGDSGTYKLIRGGIKWPENKMPVPIEVNPANPYGLSEDFIMETILVAAGEWDDGAYSQLVDGNWDGVTPNLFADTIEFTTKDYDDLAWSSDKLDGANTIVWGDYPEDGVIAVTILWYNVKTKEIIEFDIVLDTDYIWGDAAQTPDVMDLQNIATHELGHGIGLDDVYQDRASGGNNVWLQRLW